MTRGRETDEQTLKRIDALFFERYTGPDSVPNGYKEVDNTLYACDSAALDAAVGAGVLNSFAVCAALQR